MNEDDKPPAIYYRLWRRRLRDVAYELVAFDILGPLLPLLAPAIVFVLASKATLIRQLIEQGELLIISTTLFFTIGAALNKRRRQAQAEWTKWLGLAIYLFGSLSIAAYAGLVLAKAGLLLVLFDSIIVIRMSVVALVIAFALSSIQHWSDWMPEPADVRETTDEEKLDLNRSLDHVL